MKTFRKLIVLGAFMTGATASLASVPPPPTPVDPVEMSSSSDSDPTGAIILLALIGMVVASSGFAATRAKTEKDPYLLPTDDDN